MAAEKARHARVCSYIVLETDAGNRIVTELLRCHRAVAWSENPDDLDARNATARVFRSKACDDADLSVSDIKYHYVEMVKGTGLDCGSGRSATVVDCMRYAQTIYDLAGPAEEISTELGASTEGSEDTSQAAEQAEGAQSEFMKMLSAMDEE